MKSLTDYKTYDYIYVDAMNLVSRNYHGMRALKYNGLSTGMLFGVTRFWFDYHSSKTKIIFLWEGFSSWRKEKYSWYKASRKSRPKDNDFLICLKYVQRVLPLMGIDQYWHDGLEADDLAGHFAIEYGRRYNQHNVLLVSGDQDWWQFVNSKVDILTSHNKKTGVYTYDEIKKVLDFPPEKLGLYKTLKGDQSDEIKGILRFPTTLAVSVAKSCDNINDILPYLKDEWLKWYDIVKKSWDVIEQNAELIIYDDSRFDIESLRIKTGSLDKEILRKALLKNGINSYASKLEK